MDSPQCKSKCSQQSDDQLISTSLDDSSQLNSAKNQKRKYYRKKNDKVQRWTQQECDLYAQFIEDNLENYLGSNDKSGKRNKKNFILMSQNISTKTPCQCRSHHQKFFKKTLDKILETNKNKTDIQQYQMIQENIKNMFNQKKRIKKINNNTNISKNQNDNNFTNINQTIIHKQNNESKKKQYQSEDHHQQYQNQNIYYQMQQNHQQQLLISQQYQQQQPLLQNINKQYSQSFDENKIFNNNNMNSSLSNINNNNNNQLQYIIQQLQTNQSLAYSHNEQLNYMFYQSSQPIPIKDYDNVSLISKKDQQEQNLDEEPFSLINLNNNQNKHNQPKSYQLNIDQFVNLP